MLGKKEKALQTEESQEQQAVQAQVPVQQPVQQSQVQVHPNQFLVGQSENDFAVDLALIADVEDERRARILLTSLVAKMNGEICAMREKLVQAEKKIKFIVQEG